MNGLEREPHQANDGQFDMVAPSIQKTNSDPTFSSITTKMCSDAFQQDILPNIFRLDAEACPAQQDAEITVAVEIVRSFEHVHVPYGMHNDEKYHNTSRKVLRSSDIANFFGKKIETQIS